MIDSIYHLIHARANWQFLSFLLVSFIICQQLFGYRQEVLGCEHKVPDIRFGYGPTAINELFNKLGPKKLNIYAWSEVTLDLIFLLVYGLLFAILLSVLFPGLSWHWLVLIPLGTALADLLENIILAALAWSWQGEVGPIVYVAASCTIIKFIGFTLTLGLLLIGSMISRVE